MNVITRQDATSATWARIKEHLEKRIEAHRLRNDSVALDADETSYLRGQIAEVKYLMNLDAEEPHITE